MNTETNTVNIISPCLQTKSHNFNINVTNDKHNIVSYGDNDSYVIINKNGSMPDINIDEQTLDKLLEARKLKNVLSAVIDYLENTDEYNRAIMDDKSVLMEIINTISVDTPTPECVMAYIVKKCPGADKYRTKGV